MRSTNVPYRSYHIAAQVLSLTAMGLASLVLIGWSMQIPTLRSFVPGFAVMKVTTAFGFLFAGTSVLWLNATQSVRASQQSRLIRPALPAAVAGLFGLGTLIVYAAGIVPNTDHPAWMSPATAVSFVLFALAAVTFQSETRAVQRISEAALLLMVWMSALAVVGYLYNARSLYTFKPYVSIALPTALSFVFIGMALLFVRPDRGFMAIVLSPETGGLMLRRIVPLTLAMVVVIGSFRLAGEITGTFGHVFSLTAVVGLSMAGFGLVLWIVARNLNGVEKEWSESRIRLQLAKDAADLGIHDYDVIHGTIRWDDRVRELWGVGATEPITIETFWECVHPEDRAATKDAIDRAFNPDSDGRYATEFRVVHRTDKRIRWIGATGRAIFERGRAVRLVGTVQDITDRKQAEEVLRESEARFRTMAEAAPVGIFRTDSLGHCVYVNGWWLQMVDMTAEQAHGNGWTDRLHPDDRDHVFKIWLSAVKSHRPFSAEYRFVNPSGQVTWVLGHAVPETGGGYVGITMDITERKYAEEALRESERRFRELVERSPFGIYVVDSQFRIIHMNEAGQRGAFRNVRPVIGRDLVEAMRILWPERVAADIIHVFRCTLDTAESYYSRDFVNPRADVEQVEGYEWELHQLTLPNGEPGVICYYFDSTKLRETEKALREAHERLRRWNENLEQAVNAKTAELQQSHERLRELASELSLAEHRERKRLATELHDHLQQILVYGKMAIGQGKRRVADVPAAAEVMTTVDDVLSEALTYSRTLVAELSPPVLRDEGLAAGLKWLGEYMKKYHQTVTVLVPEQQKFRLPEAHRVLLFQSVRELLINASKHAGTETATVLIEQRDENLHVTVSDEGKGCDLTVARGTPSGGISSKFGLFSIQERMRALGGSFIIRSAIGQGTTATLILPLARDTESNAPEMSRASVVGKTMSAENSGPRMKGRTMVPVLLVDDHAMVRQGLRAVLDAYDDLHVVAEAQDGAEAVKLVGDLHPRVVVMDINMPRMDGIDATTHIKTYWPETTVIGISVNTGDDNSEAMKRAGAAIVLPKDTAVDQLHDAIIQEVGA